MQGSGVGSPSPLAARRRPATAGVYGFGFEVFGFTARLQGLGVDASSGLQGPGLRSG